MILKKLVRFLIFSNIYISLCASALGGGSFIILDPKNYSIPLPVILFLFCATLFVYNFNFLFIKSHAFQSQEKQEWIETHLTLIRLMVICSAVVISLATVYFTPPFLLLVLLPLGILSLFYSFPFKTHSFSLKKIPLLKVFLISFVWSAATVALPAEESHHYLFSMEVVLLFIERMFFILALAIPFDIRDYELDKGSNILTIPGSIGVSRSKMLSVLLLLLYFGITALFECSTSILLARLATTVLGSIIIYRIKKTSSEYYYMALIDGMMIVQSALVFIFNKLHL